MPVRARSRAFEFDEERAAVVLNRAQVVEFGVISARDDVAVAEHRAGLGRDGAFEQRSPARVELERRRRIRKQGSRRGSRRRRSERGHAGERIAQSGEVARTRTAQRDARSDARDVDGALEFGDQALLAPSRWQSVRRLPRGARAESRAARSGLASHCRSSRLPAAVDAGVEQRQQRRRRLAAQRLGDFEIAPCRGIERKMITTRARRRASECGPARRASAASPARSAAGRLPPAPRVAHRRRRMPPDRCVPSCAVSRRVAASASNCQGGSARDGTPSRHGRLRPGPSPPGTAARWGQTLELGGQLR